MSKPLPIKEIDGMMYRKCNKCQKYKMFDDFYKYKNKKYGIQDKCKMCFKEYYKQNKERVKEYYDKNKDKEIKRSKDWRNSNKEKYSEYQKEWNDNNKNYRREYVRKRYRDDDIYNLQTKLRKSNYKNLKRALEYYNNGKSDKIPSKSPSRLLLKLYEIQNHNCPYCSNNMKDDIHIDHIIPLSKNGSNQVHNLILCCSTCNLRKNAKELDVWLSECNINCDKFMLDIEKRNKVYFSDVMEIK